MDDAGIGAEHRPARNTLGIQWHDLLRTAHDLRRLRRLLDTAVAGRPALHDKIEELIRPEPVGKGNPVDSYEVRLLGVNKRPMINRVDLRAHVRQLFGGERVVLTVRGPGRSGKSYSYRLMSHVARGCQGHDLLLFDFVPSSGDTARELLAVICRRLGLEDVTVRPKWTTTTKFVGEMMDDFVRVYREKFAADGKTKVLVIDGLERFEVGSDVYSFAARLAVEVGRDQLRDTQLVLIGYQGVFDPAIDHVLLFEDIKLITATDLRDYFAGLAADLGHTIPKASLTRLANRTLQDNPDLATLNERVATHVRGLIEKAS